MKNILFLSLWSLCASVQGSIVLEYGCSDGLYQSRLTIDDTGQVVVDESCFDVCPEHTYSKIYQLSPKDLSDLNNAIAELQAQAQITRQVKISQDSCRGLVKVFHKDAEILVSQIYYEDYASMADVSQNTSPSAGFLTRLPLSYVKIKMATFSSN